MEEKFIPRLTGGTFFNLLLQARRPGRTKRDALTGSTDELSETNMLSELMKVAWDGIYTPAGSTLKNNTSLFKSCEMNHSSWLIFDDVNKIEEFDIGFKTEYPVYLKRMNNYTKMFLDPVNHLAYKRLAFQILELIQADETIDEDDAFYFNSGTQVTTKAEIATNGRYNIQGLLLGTWHYIITHQILNSDGKETFSKWMKKGVDPRTLIPQYIGDFAKNIQKYTIISLSDSDVKYEINPTKQTKQEVTLDDTNLYLSKLNEKFSSLKTLLYNDVPHDFYEFYVCNDLMYRGQRFGNRYGGVYYNFEDDLPITKDCTAIDLMRKYTNFALITGSGGLGKSMMMRHLLLNSIEKYEEFKLIPFFIALKDYATAGVSLVDFIYSKIKNLYNINKEQFKQILSDGNALILLDGFDEIRVDISPAFESELEAFSDKYSSNMFVMSSRPYQSFVSFSRFHEFRLCPFRKDQALDLVDKLEFRPDEPQIKEKFKDQLDKSLFYSHSEFSKNPLLLTIMLMTFEQYAEVPQKMHVFYREAFFTLAQKHDATKGAYKRKLKTGLTIERFSEYLEEFCSRTYVDEKFEFSNLEIEKYFNLLNEKKRFPNESISYNDFIYDLESNMCLIYHEGRKYHFTHRSFQEYFCALYFSKRKDKQLKGIGDFFEKKKTRMYGDKTFNMLHDMIPDKVEEYIFLPYMEELVDKCQKGDDYLTFLEEIYPEIWYTNGIVDRMRVTEPNSYTYNKIAYLYKFKEDCAFGELTPYDDLVYDEFIAINLENGDYEIISLHNCHFEKGDEPEPEGWLYRVNIPKIFKSKDKYADLIKEISNPDFDLYKEYKALIETKNRIKDKQDNSGDGLFDF